MLPSSEQLPQELSPLRALPATFRLNEINRLFVREIECLGYDLAHHVDTGTVTTVFLTASEIEGRLRQLQETIQAQSAD